MKINEMTPGNDNIEFEAIIAKVTVGKTNGNNKSNYLNLVLDDQTGSIDAKLWSATPQDIENFIQGTLVKGKGDIIKYNGNRQMKVSKLAKIDATDQQKMAFIPCAPLPVDEMMDFLDTQINKIKEKTYHDIVVSIMKDHREAFKYAPAASHNHHEFVSGLLYHTYTMVKCGLAMCDIYTSLDQDLLISGIILHDIGKIQELSGPIAPVYTLEGNLLGHISIGAELVKRKADELGFKGEKVTLLIHMILSHHGAKEYGSPVLPMIKEAEILSLIDNIDARMNMFEKALAETEEGEYTKRIFALENRNIYKPKKA